MDITHMKSLQNVTVDGHLKFIHNEVIMWSYQVDTVLRCSHVAGIHYIYLQE